MGSHQVSMVYNVNIVKILSIIFHVFHFFPVYSKAPYALTKYN